MTKENFNAETKSFKDLVITDNIYSIPPYQRDYSWDDSNSEWEDLWNDITSNDDKHYIGFIVLKSENDENNNYEVIDGQQRLATISIIVLSALNILKDYIRQNKDIDKVSEEKRLSLLISDFVGREDRISMEFYNKLKLNKTNDNYFKFLCKSKLEDIDVVYTEKKCKSNKLLEQAFNFFRKKIIDYINEVNGENVSKFIEKMSQKLFFTILYVNSTANAYTLFETLNARGMKLASVDLLKNFLFSSVADNNNHLSTMQSQWNEITNNIKEGDLNKFIRTDWGSRNNLVEDRKLYNTISKKITNGELAFSYLNELKKSSDYFSLLMKPQDDYWKQNDCNQDVCEYLEGLQLLRIKQVYGIFISYLKKIGVKDFHKLVRWMENISFRFNTISSLDAKEQEKVYNDIAMKIFSGDIQNLEDIKKHLKKVYVGKNDFISKFSVVEMKSSQTIKYVLDKVNQHLGGAPLKIDNMTIEHVLSRNPNGDWDSFNDPEDFVWRIGNMTLLTKGANGNLDNKMYKDKVGIYSNDMNPIVKTISENVEWNQDSIYRRQLWMANLASEIWNIPELED